ncbi:MAG: xanthine dehydrogenase [Calditrichaeota bacterium]|nr:MAG: xanthine dehydrogenase [Calditrichota bacterium]MBL1205049.1 xanthine dehydrogenase [Calditrichota bacterium]NOG44879.1 molybdopterin-dependent oxidoreductase [Calditrichota bacterium]
MKNTETNLHVRGLSQFIDDRNVPEGTLHAAVFDSPIAHGDISKLDIKKAKSSNGVVDVLTFKDIPGQNQVGNIIADEVLLAEKEVEFIGQPIAIVVAQSAREARAALSKIKIDTDEKPPVTDPREAAAKGNFIAPPRTFSLGNTQTTWQDCDLIVEGIAESGGQEHLYLEMQGALATPKENGKIEVISSTQGPTSVQKTVARILDIPMHKIEVDVLRLGGGFGGKEDQATIWACLAALAANVCNKPVKLVLRRHEDMRMTGKRHPYTSDFKIGLSSDLKILAYEAQFYQNAGASADLSTAILERTLFHATNSYFIPNVQATAYSCRTNLPPNTAFRGFGGPQGMFVIESAIAKAAEKLDVDPIEIQKANLLNEGDTFPYGQIVKNGRAKASWDDMEKRYELDGLKKQINKFNSENTMTKKGLAVMPICFGISFTATFLNQANALVHVYSDGSVGVSTGAVEMGQGVNMKMRQVASTIFSIAVSRVHTETTNTSRNANTSPTAASAGADLNGHATKIACENILTRLKKSATEILFKGNPDSITIQNEVVYFNGEPTNLSWNDLITQTYLKRISMSAHAHYSTPEIYFDKAKEKGLPFAYHTFGAAIVEASVDCLRGTYHIDKVHVSHDFGKSMNELVDLGQAEGGIVQGLGWMTLEEIIYNKKGKLQTGTLSTYKVPDIYFAPDEINVHFLENPFPNAAIFNSKAIGEPPLMYGIGGYFAILDAIKAFRPEIEKEYIAPMTNERVLMMLHKMT